MNVMHNFLEAEISSPELYRSIIEFICSFHIRNGEFEGNEFVIKKMDQINYIIFPEYECPDGHREIHAAISIYRKQLLQAIQQEAHAKGFPIVSYELEE